jgi:endonuclease/exonuclease/phosphatase family metal-dependent hydrolase
MRGRVYGGVYAFGTVLLAVMAAAGAPSAAQAQTTVVLDAPHSEVADTVLRAGDYADDNFDTAILITRASRVPDYERRALLKFDTHHKIPAKAPIRSATLTLTLRGGGDEARRISAYRIAESFDQGRATWRHRKRGYRWRTQGGLLGRKYAETTVLSKAGSRITFDVTDLVQETVNGKYASRYTRVALIDEGLPSNGSYREYHSSEASNPGVRPTLKVVYGSRPPAPAPPPPPPPPPPPAPRDEDEDDEDGGEEKEPEGDGGTSSLRVLHWNTQHGRGTDNDYDIDRIARWIAKMNPDVVSLNEVERFSGAHGNEDQPARYAALLRAKTGRKWYYHFAQRYGDWSSKGQGNVVLSRYPIDATASLALRCDRSAALATLDVNGRAVTVVSTHLANDSGSCRWGQAAEIASWVRNYVGPRIIAGDWNAGQQRSEVRLMLDSFQDAWAVAKGSGDSVDYPGNSRPGATHDYRIDYVFFSKSAALRLQKAQVFDTRGGGARPSDHKPLLVTFRVD